MHLGIAEQNMAVTGMPVAWKLVPATSPPLYANPGSDHARRGKFATKTLWVTPHSDAELYPAGVYPLEPSPQGIEQWTSEVRCFTHHASALISAFIASGITFMLRDCRLAQMMPLL